MRNKMKNKSKLTPLALFVLLQPLTEFSHIVFGTENDDPILRQGKSDWLYGGTGDDTFSSREAWKEAA